MHPSSAWTFMDILPYLRFDRQIRSFFVSQSKGTTPGKYHELVNLRNSTKVQKNIRLWIFRGPLVHLPMYSWIVFASVFCYCLKVSKCDWFDPSLPARSAEVLQLLKPSQELLHQRKMAMRFVMVYGWPCSIVQDGVRIPKFIQINWSIFTVAFSGWQKCGFYWSLRLNHFGAFFERVRKLEIHSSQCI